jgi:CHASE2 domain-containing sensor protein
VPERVRIFISYRRDDSILHAKLIHNELARRFGEDHVFLDIEDIRYGDDFKETIDEKIRGCNVVIAVIGPQWAEMLERRLAHADDYVRHEIASALARHTRVIPVLVGKATPAALGAVPEDLTALRTLNALPFSERDLKPSINALVEAVQGRPFEEVAETLARGIRSARRAQLAGAGIGLLVFLAASVQLLDFLTLDTRCASLTMWLGGLGAAARHSEGVVMVTIDGETEKRIGRKFDRSWRREHAQLVDRLSEAGARTIAFDMLFKEAMPEEDKRLADAFAGARQRKTAIVAALPETLEDGVPSAPEPLKQVLGQRVGGRGEQGWGIACLGEKLGYARSMPLVVERGTTVLPSLALAAFSGGGPVLVEEEAFEALEVRVQMAASGNPAKVGFSVLEEVAGAQEGCRAITMKDRAGLQLLEPSPAGFWLQPSRRLAYEQVLGARADELGRVKDKIVLVGLTKPGEDQHAVTEGLRTTSRFGIELIADQIDAIQRGEVIRPLGTLAQLGFMVLLALGGAYAQRWGGRRPALVRCSALLGLGIVYLAAVVVAYREYGLLLNLPYEIGAFALAYALMRWLEKRHAR